MLTKIEEAAEKYAEAVYWTTENESSELIEAFKKGADFVLKDKKSLFEKVIKDIKYMTNFIYLSAQTITSGNYSHKQSGISHAATQIDKVLDSF